MQKAALSPKCNHSLLIVPYLPGQVPTRSPFLISKASKNEYIRNEPKAYKKYTRLQKASQKKGERNKYITPIQ